MKILFLAIVFFVSVFLFKKIYFFFQHLEEKISKNENVIITPTPIVEKKWLEFKDENVGISFRYPTNWEVSPFNWSITFGTDSGHWELYAHKKDSDNGFLRFMIFEKNYFPFYEISFAKKQVNPDWTLEEFLEQMEIPEEKKDNIFFVQKLNERALLVAFWEQEVLSPYTSVPVMILNVLVPWSEDFPNLEIRIYYHFFQDPRFSSPPTSSEEFFNFYLNKLKEIVPLVQKREYSQDLNDFIDTANFIARSVSRLK